MFNKITVIVIFENSREYIRNTKKYFLWIFLESAKHLEYFLKGFGSLCIKNSKNTISQHQ